MKKILLVIFSFFIIQNISMANDYVQFNFPNDGWIEVESPDGVSTKRCYIPYSQNPQNYTEMLIFQEKLIKNKGVSPMIVLHKQLGKDRINYQDITPEYIRPDSEDAMVTWCSEGKNTCALKRAFQGKEGIIMVTYINRMPHYSQNMFGQWSNILNAVKLYEVEDYTKELPKNVIEL